MEKPPFILAPCGVRPVTNGPSLLPAIGEGHETLGGGVAEHHIRNYVSCATRAQSHQYTIDVPPKT